MLAIRMKFLAGRFHATPWGHHVNEGVVEYPPSSWRLLRSLVATFYRTFPARAHENGGDNDFVSCLKGILAKLSAPPEFRLPDAAVAHTRHYDQDNNGVKFFDTFISVSPDAQLLWLWPDVALDERERELLAGLLAALGTFGRAESWCEATLLSEEESRSMAEEAGVGFVHKSQPMSAEADLVGLETTRLLLPVADADAGELFETLKVETGAMRQRKQLEPTGSRWVTYTRPRNVLQPRRGSPARPRRERHYTVARFALSSSVLPLVQDALPFAEQVRRELMYRRRRVGGEHSEVITGKTVDGVPLTGHEHTHYLPTDEGERRDGRLNHITIYAPRGFGREDVAALGNLQVIERKDNRPEVRLVLTGLGTVEDFANEVPLFRKARCWRSVTPFSLPRFATRGAGKPPRPRDRPEEQLKRELRLRGLPELVSVRCVDEYVPGERPPVRWLEFQTRRFKGETGYGLAGFEIEFAETEPGPLALGFACHFGLGLFVPVD